MTAEDCLALPDNHSLQPSGSVQSGARFYLKRGIRLLAGLYVAACVLIGTLVLTGTIGVMGVMFANDPNHGEEANVKLIANAFKTQPKSVDLSALNNGDWSLACVLGRGAHPSKVADFSSGKGIRLVDRDLARLGPQKSKISLIYIQKSGNVRWLLPLEFSEQAASGEVLCVTPDVPVLLLPTAAAIAQRRY